MKRIILAVTCLLYSTMAFAADVNPYEDDVPADFELSFGMIAKFALGILVIIVGYLVVCFMSEKN